jgi:hypothetical protein
MLTLITAQWLLYVPRVLTLTISTFCPHSVFMCFVWISEQTAIISLCNINWLVFVTETEYVYCAVRTGSLNNSTFCPHSVFMCFVWISEQTAIISLYSIDWLVFLTEMECVYRAVRNESLCIIQVNFLLYKAMSSLRRLVSSLSSRRTMFDPKSVHLGFVVDRVTLEQVFLGILKFPLFAVIPLVLHSRLHLHVALSRRTNGRRVGNFQKTVLCRKPVSVG